MEHLVLLSIQRQVAQGMEIISLPWLFICFPSPYFNLSLTQIENISQAFLPYDETKFMMEFVL
jgi:hypothetical protein